MDKIKKQKTKHIWSIQIMEKLLDDASSYQYEMDGKRPHIIPQGEVYQISDILPDLDTVEAADIPGTNYDYEVLEPSDGAVNRTVTGDHASDGAVENEEKLIHLAAKNGVVEMVAGILKRFPVAIFDMNNEKKNVVLVSVEHRQPHVYKLLLDRIMNNTVFRETDMHGNSALHLAARLREYKPWLIPGPALQMQWEIKWFEVSICIYFFN